MILSHLVNSNCDDFNDRLLPHYSFHEWTKGFYPEFASNISENAKLILAKITYAIEEKKCLSQHIYNEPFNDVGSTKGLEFKFKKINYL